MTSENIVESYWLSNSRSICIISLKNFNIIKKLGVDTSKIDKGGVEGHEQLGRPSNPGSGRTTVWDAPRYPHHSLLPGQLGLHRREHRRQHDTSSQGAGRRERISCDRRVNCSSRPSLGQPYWQPQEVDWGLRRPSGLRYFPSLQVCAAMRPITWPTSATPTSSGRWSRISAGSFISSSGAFLMRR